VPKIKRFREWLLGEIALDRDAALRG